MPTKTLLVTGSSGLIGSEVCVHFAGRGWRVVGVDNNQREVFFGPQGDTRWNQRRLQEQLGVLALLAALKPNAIVHTAAQPRPNARNWTPAGTTPILIK